MQGLAPMTTQDARPEKLKIRIPKRMWNECKPSTPVHATEVTKLAIRTRPKVKPGRRTAVKDCADDAALSPTSPRGCKVKVWRFRYGGPKHTVKGKLRNEVTLETPCLRATCANCWKWHPHLMYNQEAPEEPCEWQMQQQLVSAIEPTSPEIDPRILDGSWKFHQSRRASVASITSIKSFALPDVSSSTPTLTPVKFAFSSCNLSRKNLLCPYEINDNKLLQFCPDIFQPTSLMNEAMLPTSTEYTRRLAYRPPQTTCLVFRSQAGKKGFSDLVRKRERKVKKAAYDRAYRARMKVKKEQEQQIMSWGA